MKNPGFASRDVHLAVRYFLILSDSFLGPPSAGAGAAGAAAEDGMGGGTAAPSGGFGGNGIARTVA
jgi:hypothetical protein